MKLLHQFTIGFSFLLFLFLFIPTVSHAESGQTYEVSSALLNVRSEPAPNAQIIGQLTTGDKVVAFKESYGWIQTYLAGQEVWIAKHHLISVGSEKRSSETNTSEKITIAASGVNVRSGPGTNHSIIGSVSSGNTYNVIETAGDWYKVSLSDRTAGWVAGWLTRANTKTTTSSGESNSEAMTLNNESTNKSLSGYNIVLDPGHGGKDPGSIGLYGVKEKDVITSTANVVVQKLRNAGANVMLTRTSDHFISLAKRVRISESYDTHAFISLHYNAYPIISVNGVSTYYANGNSQKLAQDVQSSLASSVNLRNRGVMQADFHVIHQNSAPSILMELGFITNPNDLSVVQTSDYQGKVAQAITNGLKNYFHE